MLDDRAVDQVRRFNRLVTERIGALDEHYLARSRPLGQSRVLWEIGPDGAEVRDLRRRLDLDSGYLSRLLRSLERSGLVTVAAAAGDRRVRTARLTPAGADERALLDERSDALARELVAPLSPPQQRRLVGAMAEVEALLTASLVRLSVVDPGEDDAQRCLRRYFAELDDRFDAGYDPEAALPLLLDEMRAPRGRFVVARLRGEAVGCGVVKLHGAGPADIKRMWVAPEARGLGLGRRLLTELEVLAAAEGARSTQLETNRALAEAISLYRSSGYVEVAPFNDEPYGHHWFRKALG
ncbi:MAG: MarR family transcriptional regulator [Acidimicrobiales bacterium]|nr:MarR family transcriptional regulator [Acidimicrobiales bacterium]